MKTVGRWVESGARTVVLSLLRLYQLCLSPWLGNRCRFYPSCSQYCMDAVRRFGTIKGIGLGIIRLCKCHPFHSGGNDPVPDVPSV